MYEEPFNASFFKRLQQLKIRTRRAFLGSRQGTHRSLRKGHGLEFSDFRAYSPGDDFRHIDWNVLARTDRAYVREYREEQDLNVVILFDASASMAFPEGEGKFKMARDLGLALGYVALTDGDTVSFSLLGQKNSPRFVGPRALLRAQQFLRKAQPKGSFVLLNEVRAAVAQQKIPGKCFLVSDFLMDLEEIVETFDFLRSRNFEIVALQVLAPSELRLEFDPNELLIDAETGEEFELAIDSSSTKEYALMLSKHIEAIEQYCKGANITHFLASSEQDCAELVLTKFPEVGILR